MSNEKKVVAVIVEGPSDEAALSSLLKAFFSSDEVRFEVIHGDIVTGVYATGDITTSDNVLSKINAVISKLNERYGYSFADYCKIIHISDTDGAFTSGVVKQADVDSVRYFIDRIEAKNKDFIEMRNARKADVLRKLISTKQINSVPYKIYFNSCNLEHVLYNKLDDFTDDEKEEMADNFADEYEGKLDEFKEYISGKDIAVTGNYKETWKFIEKANNSLQRHSNMHLIFSE